MHRSTQEFKTMLETMAQSGEIESIKEYHKDNLVHFKLRVPDISKLSREEIIQKFKLTSRISLTNMVCFDKNSQIKRYNSANEIIDEFYPVRL